ncbi:MAG: galactokinase [Lachnospira sp.]|nr:galactokinase [Lachnospira sp.]
MELKEKLMTQFTNIFKETSDAMQLYFAPGRINLIGEHTDYNGGHVFPCAITLGTYAIARPRTDHNLRFYSLNFEEQGIIETTLSDLTYTPAHNWANYPKGVLWTFMQEGYSITHGMDILYYGNIPNGAGLSSSASIEVLTAYIARDIFNLDFDMRNAALMCQDSENHYNGVKCGIMDQFAIAMGKKNYAIYLDTATLEYKYVPLNLENHTLVIMNTNKQRKLGESKYNERRAECETALKTLQTVTDIQSLGELSLSDFNRYSSVLKDDILIKRARHAVSENVRTAEAVTVLEHNDLIKFGELMTASHVSLRDDYKVTGMELDTLVSTALKQPGVLGARMTGAGFGGCAIALVKADCIDDFIANTGREYLETIGYSADFYIADIGNGPCKL